MEEMPICLETSADLGRFLRASRDIEAKEVIIHEDPIVFGPREEECEDGLESLICLACSSRIPSTSHYKCKNCAYPLCSPNCSQINVHLTNECSGFSNLNGKRINAKLILLLRCFNLKERNMKSWETLMAMEDHSETRELFGEKIEDDEIISDLKAIWIQTIMFDEGEARRLIGIISSNAFTWDGSNKLSVELYNQTTLLSHSCNPNATWSISPSFEMTVRAGIKILKGEIISISYCDEDLFYGTFQRRKLIERHGYFKCLCERCKDPTECGTFLSAVNCRTCDGFLLPKYPLEINSIWVCTNGCKEITNTKEVGGIIQSFEFQIKIASLKFTKSNENLISAVDLFIEDLENLHRQYLKYFHKNHYCLIQISRTVVLLYEIHIKAILSLTTNRYVKEKHLDTFVKHSENVLRIGDILTPGYNNNRGTV